MKSFGKNYFGLTKKEYHFGIVSFTPLIIDNTNSIYMGLWINNPKIPYICVYNNMPGDYSEDDIDDYIDTFPNKLARLSLISNEYMINWAPDSILEKWIFSDDEKKTILNLINKYWKNIRAGAIYHYLHIFKENISIPETSPYINMEINIVKENTKNMKKKNSNEELYSMFKDCKWISI